MPAIEMSRRFRLSGREIEMIENLDQWYGIQCPVPVDLPDTRAIGIDSDDEAHSEWLEAAIAAEASVDEPVAAAVSSPSCQDGATAMAASRPDDASRLRDPLDIYFRHVGNDELLSRDEELALARQIDEARQKLLAPERKSPMRSVQRWDPSPIKTGLTAAAGCKSPFRSAPWKASPRGLASRPVRP
jgi:hypothetical protein